jgi:beta-galactosidase
VRIDREVHQRRTHAFQQLMKQAKRTGADRGRPVQVPDEPTPIASEKYTLLWVDSEEHHNKRELAGNAIDGDRSTYWHTEYRDRQTSHPHELIIDLGNVYRVSGFGYVPRGGNGDVRDYEFCVGRSLPELEKPVCQGTFDDVRGREEKRVLLESPVEGRYVRFRALSETHAHPYTSVAELIVLHGE